MAQIIESTKLSDTLGLDCINGTALVCLDLDDVLLRTVDFTGSVRARSDSAPL